MLYRSIRAHYSAAASLRRLLGSGDRPADRTQGETGENANDPEEREKGTQERVVALGGRSKKVTTTLKSKTCFSILKEETTTRTQDRN